MSTRISGQTGGDRRLVGIPIVGDPTVLLNTLEFDATTNTFRWVAGGGGALGDIAFLSGKEFGADTQLRQADGNRTTVGDLATLTAAVGNDMYLAKAVIVATDEGSAAPASCTVTLSINGTVIEEVRLVGKAGERDTMNYTFNASGFRVLAGQIILLEVTVVSNTPEVFGFLECFEVATGTDPNL